MTYCRLTNSCCIHSEIVSQAFGALFFLDVSFEFCAVVPISSRRPHAAIPINSGLSNDPPVDFPPVSYSHDQYQQRPSFNLVQNPIIPHMQAVDLVVACQLLNACRIRILSQSVDSPSNSFSDRSIQRAKISFGSRRELYAESQSDAQRFLDPIP